MKKRKFLKKLLAMSAVAVGILTSTANQASAATYQLQFDPPTNGNIQLQHKTTNNLFWTSSTNQTSLMRVNGDVVFCVDPPTDAKRGTYYSSQEIQAGALVDHFGTRLTDQQIEQLKNAIFWGWDMSADKSGARYLYVQAKVWEILGWNPTNFRGVISMSGYNNISNFIDGKYTNGREATWHNNQYTVKVGETLTLTDSNHVYEFLQDTPNNTRGWNFNRIDKDTVQITPTVDAEDGIFAFRTKSLPANYNRASLLLTHGSSQNLLLYKDPDHLFSHIRLTAIKYGNIKVVKTDVKTGQALAGVEFGIFKPGSETPVATATTDENGEAFFNDYDPTEWIVKEVNTVYTHRLNSQEFNVTVVPNETVTVAVTNEPKEGNLRIVKTDAETGKTLAGIEFGLYEKGSDTPVATATTNENGEVFFNNYFPKEWDIKETRTLETYRLNDQVYSVAIRDGETVTVDVTNVSKKYRVSISKHLDEALDGSGTRVVGANIQFDLVDANGTVVQTMTTDENGYALSEEIPYTTPVTIVEHAPTGYKEAQPIVVPLDTNKDNFTYHYIVENNVKKSYLQIVKTDVETGETVPASGVKFRLYKDGQLVSQQVTYPSIQTIDTFETDNNGQVTFPQQLVYGNYEIEEVQAPTGYVLSEDRLAVSITGDETVVSVKFANQPQKGELQINKTGSQIVRWEQDARGVNVPVIEERPLAGVVFELIKDGNVIEQATTDNSGIARFTNKPLGKYSYREVSAPTAYVVDSTLQEIEFTPQAQTIKVDSKSVSVHNERKNLTLNFNKTFEESTIFTNEQKATFGLYTTNAVEGLPANSLVGLAEVTGSGDYTFENLSVDGQFYLKELTTSEAYQLNDSRIGVSTNFGTSGAKAQTVVVETPIVNELKRGDHELVKVEANSKDRLEGVEFKLVAVRPNNDEVEVGRYTTDKDGRVVFKDLEYGRYYAQETKTLPDFLLNSVKYFFSIFGGEVVPTEASKEVKASDITTIIENEKQPKIYTEATTQSGGKKGYYFEKHIERAELSDLTIGKKYTVVATQYDSEGKVYATQEREFVAEADTHTELFEFEVPVGYIGNIVYGEDLYREGEKVAVHFDLKNEKQTVEVVQPEVKTQATTQKGEKAGYVFEKHIERADLTGLIVGKKYTVVATQYDSEGKVYATQEREFEADSETRTELFEFEVPANYTGDIVYGEDLYSEGNKIAVHFDLENKDQTVTVLNPKINTFAKIGGTKSMIVGEKKELVDTLTYTDFKNGQVLVRTWLVKYGTDEVVGEPVEQLLTLDGNGEVEVKLDKIDTTTLPVGKYTIMEQVFEVDENGEKGELISEHVDPFDENQSFEVRPELPKTGTVTSGISMALGVVLAGLGFVTLKRKDA